MAAHIMLEDIRKVAYETDKYFLPNFDENNIFQHIPESLSYVLGVIMQTDKVIKKSNDFKWNKRIATICHSIISSSRPRSFLSPILIGLSAMLHKKYASKSLLDSLSCLGLCASYAEILRFEASIVADPDIHSFSSECFIQYIFDNADVNMCNIDGRNTFHAMGGIKVATPSSNVQSKTTIARIKKVPSSNVIGKFGFTPLKKFEKKMLKG